ncbi:unnamed protein product [Cladocopium goreaui]|uniref:Uncharacterized protein n=1 Tax=Cladocopium goreaui TaxID=2562237 RepID=A0A9P1FNK4_9DINO|nr:unnamed protein product [Cladocopium goreaui]|mmetsp:Transcript_70952/g.156544  ORF Transcript_70952/g.156544 Transcript_70952/m.156544 type:complete len:158 (+) Transcript_70952:52-525(+)
MDEGRAHGLSASSSSPEVTLDESIRPSSRHFLQEEYRESYPFRTLAEARYELRRQKIPTADFIRMFSQAPLKESRLYELRVHHGNIARTKTAKAEQASQEQNITAKIRRSRKRELTSAEQVRQLCDVMRNLQRRTESKESRLLEKYGLGDGRRLQSA